MIFNSEILKRYFKGKYSRNDYFQVKSFFTSLENKHQLKTGMKDEWMNLEESLIEDEKNIDHILHKIKHKIRIDAPENSKTRFLITFQRVAAILIVPLILSFFTVLYFQSKKEIQNTAFAEIQCPKGVRTKFTLPDGTIGFLNSGSTLKYPVIFTNERNVTLIGEAYFDVTHDEEHPFTVNTLHLSTKVLGTQFNIIAYNNENTEELILKEGKVEVYTNQGEKLETLQPNQNLVLNTRTKQYNKNKVEVLQYVSWIEGKLVFRNENMQKVANRLGRWYNVEIEIKDAELLDYAFRATFIDEPLEEVLKLLAITAPLKYSVQTREIINNDTYKKKKVIISLDRARLNAF